VLFVFGAGVLARRLASRFGLDRAIQFGLMLAAAGSIAVLLAARFDANFLPFLCAISVFVLGMGVVNPLGIAQALSPFGEKAGAASALIGFWQMVGAAIGVWLAATISDEAMLALGVVLTAASLLALMLYTKRTKAI
jgi:DHA1 family bicyclomycin/chloramphenicol resistance-like MFS transporter